MTEREEIDMLRRLVADLTERVRALEARPAHTIRVDGRHGITPMLKPVYARQPSDAATSGRRDPWAVYDCGATPL